MDWRTNYRFRSVQEAYARWLWAEGFDELGDNYTDAVAVMLVFLTSCVNNSLYRTYEIETESGHENETGELNFLAPNLIGEEHQPTYWEFLTEENYHCMYREWHSRQPRRR
jgi:hypothetical protein